MDKPKSEHEMAEEAIAKNHAEKQKKELVGKGEEVEFTKMEQDEPPMVVEVKERLPDGTFKAVLSSGETTEEVKEEAPPETPEPEVVPETPTDEPVVAVVPPVPETVRVKVDGQEFDVPKADVDKAGSVALYQMQVATSKRLKELNDTTNALNARLKELQQPPAPVVPPPDQVEERRKKIEAIRFGSEEEAMTAINELTRPANQPDVNQIVTTVSRRLEWDSAVKGFVQDMGDLMKDPDIQSVALAREAQLKQAIQKQGQWPSDIGKFYKDLSAHLKSKFGTPAATTQTRQERKEALSEPRTAAVRQEGPPLVKVKTPSEVVAEEAKARGQRIH